MVSSLPVPSSDSSAGPSLRGEPAYSTIYAVLHDHLARKMLRPGLVLGQANVARAFNVSRVPAGVALARLLEDGLVVTFAGRGYIVPGGDPLRIGLGEGGLRVPVEVSSPLISRRDQIYPEVEHAVAVCLAYGRFILNETALAQHYDVSRTIAHEVIAQLERTGVVEQDNNNRWYAGPLSENEFKHHYEMRLLLEPEALRQAFRFMRKGEIRDRLERIRNAQRDGTLLFKLREVEEDLHTHTLRRCPNTLLLNSLRRSQRVLFATHSTFVEYRHPDHAVLMAAEHSEIYEALLVGDLKHAIAVLEVHLRRSVDVNLAMLARLGPLPSGLCPTYLSQVK
jgi:DNA-binding GntR family transcriptional regulator